MRTPSPVVGLRSGDYVISVWVGEDLVTYHCHVWAVRMGSARERG